MISAAIAVMDSERERDELAAFYRESFTRLYHIAFSRLGSRQEAEDAVQEAFSRIADTPRMFFDIPPHKRMSFVSVVVRNISVDEVRRRLRHPLSELDDAQPYESPSVEDTAVGNITRGELLEFMAGLPVEQRDTLFLKIHCDMDYAAIAGALGISEALARKRVSNARKAIRNYLEEANKNAE